MSTRPFIDFYSQHSIIPTRQDISDFRKHTERRSALYRSLGIIPGFVRGRTVLEFGPGTGDNALHTASLSPSRYVLVDANPASITSTGERMKKYEGIINYEVVDCEIEKFTTNEKFDIVLCEGVVPTQKNPAEFLRKIAGHANIGGIVAITCMDPASMLSEMLRRYIATIVVDPKLDFNTRVEKLTAFFKPDLLTLRNMSRRHEDWVIDNLIHPWGGELFSMADAIKAVEGKALAIGSSPKILNDWRWYKDIQGEEYLKTDNSLSSYYSTVHNFLDYRAKAAPASEVDNRELLELCAKIYARIFANENGQSYSRTEIAQDVNHLCRLIKTSLPETVLAFQEFASQIEAITFEAPPKFNLFHSLWGRGQQYISFETFS